MISEKQFEDIICKYPELIEDGLKPKGRQMRVHGKIVDILFEDGFGQELVVELKKGTLSRQGVGQVMDYVGRILREENPVARAMLVGSRVPPSFQKSLDYYGIEWKEISLSQLKEVLAEKKDEEFLKLFEDIESTAIGQTPLRETAPVQKTLQSSAKREPGWRSREKSGKSKISSCRKDGKHDQGQEF